VRGGAGGYVCIPYLLPVGSLHVFRSEILEREIQNYTQGPIDPRQRLVVSSCAEVLLVGGRNRELNRLFDFLSITASCLFVHKGGVLPPDPLQQFRDNIRCIQHDHVCTLPPMVTEWRRR
jgi:hypothetical protein